METNLEKIQKGIITDIVSEIEELLTTKYSISDLVRLSEKREEFCLLAELHDMLDEEVYTFKELFSFDSMKEISKLKASCNPILFIKKFLEFYADYNIPINPCVWELELKPCFTLFCIKLMRKL